MTFAAASRRRRRLLVGAAALVVAVLALVALALRGSRPAGQASGQVQVAVAANFSEPAKEIAAAFTRATGSRVILSSSSSGALAAQVTHAAPFELFLSADADRPARLEAQGYGTPKGRFTYAVGRLVLYSPDPALIDGQGAVLRGGRFSHLAIGDPALAPYGLAAEQAMTRLGVYSALAPKLVRGSSIGQAYQFVASGAAELGFIAQSQVILVKGGSRWLVPETLHAPIAQQAILLKRGAGNPAARAFAAFLKGPEARAIITRFGYRVP